MFSVDLLEDLNKESIELLENVKTINLEMDVINENLLDIEKITERMKRANDLYRKLLTKYKTIIKE